MSAYWVGTGLKFTFQYHFPLKIFIHDWTSSLLTPLWGITHGWKEEKTQTQKVSFARIAPGWQWKSEKPRQIAHLFFIIAKSCEVLKCTWLTWLQGNDNEGQPHILWRCTFVHPSRVHLQWCIKSRQSRRQSLILRKRQSINVVCQHHLPLLMKSFHVPPTEFPILHFCPWSDTN